MRRREALRRTCVAAALLGAAASVRANPHQEGAARAPTPTKRVLVVQSYGRELEPYESYGALFRAQLIRHSSHPIEFHEISLATVMSTGEGADQRLIEFVNALDAGHPVDLIVAIAGPAARFLLANRARVAPRAPLLLAGVDRRHVPSDALSANDAYVELRFDMKGALAHIFQVRPQTREVAVVFGASPLETYWAGVAEREFAPFAGRARLTRLDGLPYHEMLARVAALPADAAVFFGMYTQDASGAPHPGSEALKEIHAAATAPIFGAYETDLGQGLVGGPMVPLADMAHICGEIGARLLDGSPPSRERTVPLGMTAPTYDARELQRWNIDARLLPAGSVVRFRTPALWDTHREVVLGALAVGFLQAAFIGGLAWNLRGRRRAESELRRSREQYALALEGANDGMWDRDLRTGRVEYSPRWAEIAGAPPGGGAEDYERVLERIHPEDRGRVRAAVDARIAGGPPQFRLEYRLRLPDGTERHCLARGKVLRDADDRPYRIVGSVSDITDLKAAEEQVRDVSRRLLVAQEHERARLARELHDDITQRLARLAIDAGRLELARRDAAEEDTLGQLREGLVKLSEDVHALSYRLHPSLLQDLGLAEALQAECERLSQSSTVTATLKVRDVPARVPEDIEICLYRVAQEALTNVVRHAEAASVVVRLEGVDGGLRLAVEDDGVGFDREAPAPHPSLGQASMRERVHLVGGELDIESERGAGTTVLAFVPLEGGTP